MTCSIRLCLFARSANRLFSLLAPSNDPQMDALLYILGLLKFLSSWLGEILKI